MAGSSVVLSRLLVRPFRLLFSPREELLSIWDESICHAWIFYLFWSLVCSVFSTLLLWSLGVTSLPFFVPIWLWGIAGIYSSLVLIFGYGLFLASVMIVLTSLMVMMLGGISIKRTVKGVLYGLIPSLLLGWIPIVAFGVLLWSFMLQAVCVSDLQDMSFWEGVIAVTPGWAVMILLALATYI